MPDATLSTLEIPSVPPRISTGQVIINPKLPTWVWTQGGKKPTQGHTLSVCFASVHRLTLGTLLNGPIVHILPLLFLAPSLSFSHTWSLSDQVTGLEQQSQPPGLDAARKLELEANASKEG